MNEPITLLSIIQEDNPEFANGCFEKYHPVDISLALEDLEEDDIRHFCRLLTHENLAELLENSEEDLQLTICNFFDNDELIDVFSFLANSEVADLLGLLSTYRRKQILRYMKKSDSNILKMILSFDEDSAGGIMSTDFIALKEHLTVEQAIDKIKRISPETEIIEKLFVTDDYHRLRGIVDLRTLLIKDSNVQLKDLFEEVPFFVYATDDQEEAANLFSKYELTVLPVVNQNRAILGVITSDDIISVMEEEYNEDILAMHGVNSQEEYDSSTFESFKSRTPWLLVNLATAFLASYVVKLFEGTISQVVVLSVAMPIVTGMGGNSGSQTLSIVLTSIARGEMTLKEDWKYILKEIILGMTEGAVIGLISGAILSYWHSNFYLGVIMFFSMIFNMVIAGCMGFLIPLILDHMKIDPAVSSTIFLTTFTDTCGFFIFLGLSTIFISFLR